MKSNQFDLCVEAVILGISIDEISKTVAITLRQAQTTNVLTLVAENVSRFLVNEFREQNIIDRITVWDSQSEVEEFRVCLSYLLGGANRQTDMPSQIKHAIDDELKAIHDGEKILVEIEPVFGAAICFTAQSLRLQD